MADTKTKETNPGVMESPREAPTDNLPAPRPRNNGVQAIVPQSWQEIVAIASAICRAGMAPKTFLTKEGVPVPEKVAVAIMHGLEVGMTPMASLQSIAVINGMPGLYGDGMLAAVRASGLLEDIKETDEWDKDGPLTATCEVKRKGEPQWGKTVVARADCQKAGWWTKPGPWTLTPHRMMQMRARGWALRDKFADVLRGLRSAEEIEDMVDVTPRGTATVASTPADEPKAKNFKPSAGASSADTGQAAGSPSAAGGGDSTAKTAPSDAKSEAATQPNVKAHTGKRKTKAKVTDVKDQNTGKETGPDDGAATQAEQAAAAGQPEEEKKPAEPLVFETNFESFRGFEDFSYLFLSAAGRTPDEAKQWKEAYRVKLDEYKKHDFARVRTAVTDLIAQADLIIGIDG